MSSYKYTPLRAADCAFLLIDHQAGLFQTVKDLPAYEVRAATTALAKLCHLQKIPLITTASVPEGPNGPLMPEIHQVAPHAQFVARTGQINSWDNPEFVKAVKATGRKTLVICGIWTSVCVALPALSALGEGFRVYAVMDASGNISSFGTQITMTRLAHAGVEVIDTAAVFSELQVTWRREDWAEYAKLYSAIAPNYQLCIEQNSDAIATGKALAAAEEKK